MTHAQFAAPSLDNSVNISRSRFLRALPPESYARLHGEFEPVELRQGVILWEAGTTIRSVYFPETCVLSLVIPLKDAKYVEAATVGNEGFACTAIVHGVESSSTQAIAQIPGMAGRLSVTAFRRLLNEDAPLRELSLRYAHALFEQSAQSVACNARHDLTERCARWLLMTRDRVGSNDFPLTQEFLAAMLGVRRATVTVTAGMLQSAGMIAYVRGHVSITDGEALEGASCECYRSVRDHYDKMLSAASRRATAPSETH
jgi:CRP-like cAMP-binding protein